MKQRRKYKFVSSPSLVKSGAQKGASLQQEYIQIGMRISVGCAAMRSYTDKWQLCGYTGLYK